MRDMRLGIHPPYLELGPIAVVHREDLAVEVQQTDEGFIFPGRSLFLHG
jgi:5-formaminoimidazole-4-carboxamide-1-beta-D-ribofuranosyl 5'-monophosphate synthetase